MKHIIAAATVFSGFVAAVWMVSASTVDAIAAARTDTDRVIDTDTATEREAPLAGDAGVADDDGCAPGCGEGHRCVAGLCISLCSPPCPVDEFCTAHGECVSKYPRISAPSSGEEGEAGERRTFETSRGYLITDEREGGSKRRFAPAWFGAHIGGGFATAFGDLPLDNEIGAYSSTRTATIAFSGWFDFHYYVHKRFAVVTGLGMLNRGQKRQSDVEDVSTHDVIMYLEIPLGVKWTHDPVHVGLTVALDIGVYARTKTEVYGIDQSSPWQTEKWKGYQRVNLAPVFFSNYTFHSGNLLILPGFEVSLHLLNDLNAMNSDGKLLRSRYINGFVTIGLARRR